MAAITDSPCRPKCLETKRRQDIGQNRRVQSATKCAQQMALANVDTDQCVRGEEGDSGERRSDCSNPTARPTDSSGQGNVGPAEHVGGNFQALGRLRHSHHDPGKLRFPDVSTI
jgi:hypothetical protein